MKGRYLRLVRRAGLLLALAVVTFWYGYRHCMPDGDAGGHSCCQKTVISVACCSMGASTASITQSEKDSPRKPVGKALPAPMAVAATGFGAVADRVLDVRHLTGPPLPAAKPAYIVFGAFLG
jgi:hypothetical protein